jgi:hypothetical protein
VLFRKYCAVSANAATHAVVITACQIIVPKLRSTSKAQTRAAYIAQKVSQPAMARIVFFLALLIDAIV